MLGLDLALIGKAKILFDSTIRYIGYSSWGCSKSYEQRFTAHQYLEHEYKARVGSLVYFKTSVDRHLKNR